MIIQRFVNNRMKWAVKAIDKLSLQQKLIALYIVILLIPVIIVTFYYSRDIYDRAIHDIRNKNENALEIEKIHIKNNIESMRRTAQMVVSDMEFIDFVKSRNEADINELIEFRMNALSNVTRLQANNPAIENIRLYTTNPYVTEMWPILFHEQRIMEKPWRDEVIRRNGMEYWKFDQQTEDVLKRLPSQNTSKISLYRELDYPKDEHLGIIEISMFLRNFFPKMYDTAQDPDSVYLVFDQEMKMIRNFNHTFLEKEKIDPEKLKKQFLKHRQGETSSFEFNAGKVPHLVIFTYLDDLDSYMLRVISLEALYAETANTRNIILFGIVALVVILSVFTYSLIALLLKKMYRLKDSMKRVEKGDFDFEVEIRGSDEISELAYHFARMLGKINSLIADAVHKQAAAKEVELKALKTQIDSHFLYNTLENIKMMAEIEEKYDISDAVTSLGEMMRYNLRWKNDFVVLEEELNHIRNYIDIMNMRLDGLVTLNINVPQELMDLEILKMSLQPIVENAIKHGLRPILHKRQGIIEVTVSRWNGKALVEITDNGIGMDGHLVGELMKKITSDQEIDEIKTGNGIGLRNVHERIGLNYGSGFGLSISAIEGQSTKVSVALPCKLLKGGSHNV